MLFNLFLNSLDNRLKNAPVYNKKGGKRLQPMQNAACEKYYRSTLNTTPVLIVTDVPVAQLTLFTVVFAFTIG